MASRGSRGYIAYYIILAVATALIYLLTPAGPYVLLIASIPIAAAIAVGHVNNALGGVLRGRQATYASMLALTIAMSLGFLASIPNHYAGVALAAIMLMASAVIMHRLSMALLNDRPRIGDFTRLLVAPMALYSLSALIGLASPAASYPFLTSSIASAALSPTALFRGREGGVRNVVLYLRHSYSTLTAAFFGLGIFYAVASSVSQAESRAILFTVAIILTTALVGYVGYRSYSLVSFNIDRVVEEVYEAHRREVRLLQVPETTWLSSAIDEFVKSGRKERLLMYLSYLLASGGFSFEEVNEALSALVNYTYDPESMYDRVSVDEEVRRRIRVINETMDNIGRLTGSR